MCRVAPAIPAVPAHLVWIVLQAGPARDALSGDVGRDRGGDGRFGDCLFAPSTAAPLDALEEGEDDEQRYDADYDRDGDRDLQVLLVPRLIKIRNQKRQGLVSYPRKKKEQRKEKIRTHNRSFQERPSLTVAALVARPTEATRAADDKLRIKYDALLGIFGVLAGDLAILLGLGTRLLKTKAGADGTTLLGDARAKSVGARKSTVAARLPIGLRLVRGACG